MRRRVAALGFLAAVSLAGASAFAAHPDVGELCRLHGVRDEGDITRVRTAYVDAVRAGISEDELYPFVEEILAYKLDCLHMERVLRATGELRREGLPYFVVLSKVREGVAKGASPALVVEAAEAKVRNLSSSRDVLQSLESAGYRVRDYQNAAVIVSSYLEKGYAPKEIVSRVRTKGIPGSGFVALSGVIDSPARRKGKKN